MTGELERRPFRVVRAAAFHEAGHAVASWRQGDGIGSVTIQPGTDPITGRSFDGLFVLKGDRPRPATFDWGYRHLVMTFAGPAAQHARDPLSKVRSCARWDFTDARNFAGVMCRSRESARALLTWAQAEARALIVTDWHLVQVLASALMNDVTIDGPSATAMLDRADAEALARVARVRREHGPWLPERHEVRHGSRTAVEGRSPGIPPAVRNTDACVSACAPLSTPLGVAGPSRAGTPLRAVNCGIAPV